MKPKKFQKKLVLKKETITNLNQKEMRDILGGVTAYTCVIILCICDSENMGSC